jgi:hypothetical protein
MNYIKPPCKLEAVDSKWHSGVPLLFWKRHLGFELDYDIVLAGNSTRIYEIILPQLGKVGFRDEEGVFAGVTYDVNKIRSPTTSFFGVPEGFVTSQSEWSIERYDRRFLHPGFLI